MTRASRPETGAVWMMAALSIAQRSTCPRRQVGCVLLDSDGQVLSTGYNGVPRHVPHCTDPGSGCGGQDYPSGTGLDHCRAVHAEANALLQCPDPRRVASCIVTASPCMHCAKLLANTGCTNILVPGWLPLYDQAAADFFKGAPIIHPTTGLLVLHRRITTVSGGAVAEVLRGSAAWRSQNRTDSSGPYAV